MFLQLMKNYTNAKYITQTIISVFISHINNFRGNIPRGTTPKNKICF